MAVQTSHELDNMKIIRPENYLDAEAYVHIQYLKFNLNSIQQHDAVSTDKISIVKDSRNPEIVEYYSPIAVKIESGTTI